MIFGILILKNKFRIIEYFMAVGIVIGVVLVVQPPLIFPQGGLDIVACTSNASLQINGTDLGCQELDRTLHIVDKSDKEAYPYYWIGVALAVVVAFLKAITNILLAKLLMSGLNTVQMMTLFGFGVTLSAAMSVVILPENANSIVNGQFRIDHVHNCCILFLLSILMVLKFLCIVESCKEGSHVVCTSVRTLEIVMIIIVDTAILGFKPGWVKLVGSLLTLFSILGITFSRHFFAIKETPPLQQQRD